jgi:SAM-dependent methyltransferase
MARSDPFNTHHRRYDSWFTEHWVDYHSELLALRALLPWQGLGLEIGVGTGRFAAPLGVQVGIDPSMEMLIYAVERGISCVRGVAEALPFKDEVYDYGLIVTTICFVDSVEAMLSEVYRVLIPGGLLIIGFIDQASRLGQRYTEKKSENVFYREATFYSVSEVEELLTSAGFVDQAWGQTLSKPLNGNENIEPMSPGHGKGSFVVVKATRS